MSDVTDNIALVVPNISAPAPARISIAQQMRIKLALTPWEREETRRLRRDVFCAEQGIFRDDDADATDAIAMPIIALLEDGNDGREAVGTVRIHEPEPGVWHGSRLAVAQHARRTSSVGSGLIKLAVSTAHAHGCHTFLAQVQSQNVPLFRRLHWRSLSELDIHGRAHHLMQADLDFYPPISNGDIGFVLARHGTRGEP